MVYLQTELGMRKLEVSKGSPEVFAKCGGSCFLAQLGDLLEGLMILSYH